MTSTPRVYANPPIEEALVEVRFAPGRPWDPTLPGILKQHSRLREDYGGVARQLNVLHAQVQAQPGMPAAFAVQESPGSVQLSSPDGRHLLMVGQDVVSVHELRPYPGWNAFRSRIEAVLGAYTEVVGSSEVIRVGVRYINRVVLGGVADAPKLFRCSPATSTELGTTMTGFVHRAEHTYEDGVKLLMTHATGTAPPGESAVVLDLDLVWDKLTSRTTDDILEVVDDLHRREGAAFESLITDEARKRFDAGS